MTAIQSFLAALILAPAAFSADPVLLQMIPPDAAVIAGVNIDQIRNSRFGQLFLQQLQKEEADFEKFVAATSFDPRHDLSELIVVATGERARSKGIVLARGRFDAGRIASLAKSFGATVGSHAGIELLTAGKAQDRTTLAILDANIAVAGEEAQVRTAIDRFRQPGGAVTAAGNKIHDLSVRYDAWMLATSIPPMVKEIQQGQVNPAMRANLLQSVESALGGVRFAASGVELAAEAVMRSDKDATAMIDVVRFLTGVIQLNSHQDEKAKDLTALLEKMELAAVGKQFRMSLMIPEDMLEKLGKSASRSKRPPLIRGAR